MQTFCCALVFVKNLHSLHQMHRHKYQSSGLLTYCKEWWDVTAQCCHVPSCRGRRHVRLQCWYLANCMVSLLRRLWAKTKYWHVSHSPSEVQFNWM